MTYSVTWKLNKRYLRRSDILKSDTLNAGMMEQVLDDLISWHDIRQKDLDRVLTYIQVEFSPKLAEIASEKHTGCMVNLQTVCAVDLSIDVNCPVCEERY